MTARNTYATLAEYKAFATSRGQSATTDATDDAVIDGLLEAASRYADNECARFFYPRIETRYYSLPSSRVVDFDADLQSVLSFLNGDATSISASDYNLLPRNETPKYALQVKETSSLSFETDSGGESEYVLALQGIWGYHNHYVDAWTVGSTLSEDLDTSETGWDVASITNFSAGKIVKVDNEIGIVASATGSTVTVLTRPQNGSTAASHLSGATVYIWEPMQELRNAVMETALRAYKRRSGQSQGNDSIVTANGAILPPKDIPMSMVKFCETYQRIV